MTTDGAAAGGCLCGGVRFILTAAPIWVGHCHCASCRRSVSSGVATFVGASVEGVGWEGASRRRYASSPGVERQFCGICGSQLAYQSASWPDEIHLYLALFDDPERFSPTFHVHCREALSWTAPDHLPRHLGAFGESE